MSGKKSGARLPKPGVQADESKPAGLSDAERMAEWRRKRALAGPIDTPKSKYGWGKKKVKVSDE